MELHISPETLEQFFLGRLSSTAESELRYHLGACPTCKERLNVGEVRKARQAAQKKTRAVGAGRG